MLQLSLRSLRLLASIYRYVALVCVIAAGFFVQTAAFAHEGHDHEDASQATLAASTFPRVATQSELYQLVGVLKNNRLTVYIDRQGSNEPVTNAKLSVTVGDGQPVDATSTGEATYTAAVGGLRDGTTEIVFNVAVEGGDDLLVGSLSIPDASPSTEATNRLLAISTAFRLPVLIATLLIGFAAFFIQSRWRPLPSAWSTAVPVFAVIGFILVVALIAASRAEQRPPQTPTSMSDSPRRLPDGSAFVSKSTQRLLDVRTTSARTETASPATTLIGRVIGDPNRTGVVQSIHGGRIVPLEQGLPRIGQSVRKGDNLVQVDPLLPLADRTTISEKSGEIEQLIAVAEMKIRRLRPLAERGAVPQSQVADLETELEGLHQRRESIRKSRSELEMLMAPTDGVIAAVRASPGQVVQAQDVLFQIVDPGSLWVEALAYSNVDPAVLSAATAVTTGGQNMPLAFQGFSRTLQQQASVLQFAIKEVPTNLSIGQPVTLVVNTDAPKQGVIVGRESVVRSANGESVVWVHTDPERFEPKPVRVQPFDATRVLVAAGLADGDRIAVRGADLINQIR